MGDEPYIYLCYCKRPWNSGAQEYGKFRILSIRIQVLRRIYKFELHTKLWWVNILNIKVE
jgi:hypothetical protein